MMSMVFQSHLGLIFTGLVGMINSVAYMFQSHLGLIFTANNRNDSDWRAPCFNPTLV